MPTELAVLLVALATGILSGVTGVGGALLLIPLLLTVPPLVGAGALTPKEVAGLSAVHVAVTALVGAAQHRRRGVADPHLIARVGASMVPGGLVGGLASGVLPNAVLLLTYAAMATAAFALLVAPDAAPVGDESAPPSWPEAAGVGAVVGLLAGVVGAGGAFLLIPLLVRRLRVPLRRAIGSSLAITLVGAAGTLLGKLAGGQILWALAPWIVGGAVPGVLVGVGLGHRLPTRAVRRVLLCMLLIVVLRAWVDAVRWAQVL
jgi:uncharacterized membrane protein YfcA